MKNLLIAGCLAICFCAQAAAPDWTSLQEPSKDHVGVFYDKANVVKSGTKVFVWWTMVFHEPLQVSGLDFKIYNIRYYDQIDCGTRMVMTWQVGKVPFTEEQRTWRPIEPGTNQDLVFERLCTR